MKQYLTIEALEKMKGEFKKVKGETTFVASHDGGRRNTYPATGFEGLKINESAVTVTKVEWATGKSKLVKQKYWVLEWSDDQGNPRIEVSSKTEPIKQIADLSDSDYLHSLYIIK